MESDSSFSDDDSQEIMEVSFYCKFCKDWLVLNEMAYRLHFAQHLFCISCNKGLSSKNKAYVHIKKTMCINIK